MKKTKGKKARLAVGTFKTTKIQLEVAKRLGINISKTCRLALDEEIKIKSDPLK